MKIKINGKTIDTEEEGLDVQKAVDDQIAVVVTEATTTLTDKNTELLGEVKTIKKKLVPEDEIAGLRDTASKYETLKADKMKGNAEYQKLLDESKTQHTQELESRDTTIKKLNGQLNTTLVDGTLSKALSKAKVNPALINAATTMLAGKVAVIDQGEVKVALIGDKTIPDYVAEWATSDEGKHFVSAPGNGGGGSGGDGSGGANVDEHAKFFDPNNAEYNETKQADLYKTDPKAYEQLEGKYANVQKTA